jgi:hypothetical protein
VSESANLVAVLLARAAADLRTEWQNLTAVGVRLLPEKQSIDQAASVLSRAGKCGLESIKRKLYAIQYAHTHLSMAEEDIVDAGQESVLSQFQKKTRADTYEKQTWMQFKIAGSLRELFMQEKDRVSKVLKFQTSEIFFEWLYAQLHNTTDDELRQSAGENPKESR